MEFKNGVLYMLKNPGWTRIAKSYDLGNTISEEISLRNGIYPNIPDNSNTGFITNTNSILVPKISDNNKLFYYDSNIGWYYTGVDITWLGNIGIDQSEQTNIIMIAEYITEPINDSTKVIRSIDGGKTWDVVLEKRGLGYDPREIRHFHTCQVDPYTDNWYVSSGDLPEESKLWVSYDNGDNWVDITDPKPVVPIGFDPAYSGSLFRFTGM